MPERSIPNRSCVLLILTYVLLFTWQINLAPMQRCPNWDNYWGDSLMAGKLATLKHALVGGELPAITPYVGFGWRFAGDTTLPVSVFSLPNLLALFFSPETVLVLRTMVFLFLGGLGTFFYLRFVGATPGLSVLGALVYISLPFGTAMNYYYNQPHAFYLLPFLLLLVHCVLQDPRPWKYTVFAAWSLFIFASGDVHTLIMLPTSVAIYAMLAAVFYHRLGFVMALKRVGHLAFLCVLAASFFAVPLYSNLREISSALADLRDAGIYTLAPRLTLGGFISFFQAYGLPTMYKPIEGSGLLLYAPALFYLVIVAGMVLRRRLFQSKPQRAVVPVALVAIGAAMFALSVCFYAFPGLAGMGRGVLRYHINLIPYCVVLAGVVCFSALNASPKPGALWLYAVIAAGSLLVDIMLFTTPEQWPVDRVVRLFFVSHTARAGASCSNLINVRFLDDMWTCLPWLHLAFLVLVFLDRWLTTTQVRYKPALQVGWGVAALGLTLLGTSVDNELRAAQQGDWQITERNAYRWETYCSRKAALDALMGPSDPNFRTLPCATETYEGHKGRNWKLIAETELQAEDRRKVLFSYKETMHPYAALLYSTFSGVYQASNWFPPLSSEVAPNMAVVRLMGVKWVVSADSTLTSPDLLYRGEVTAPKATSPLLGPRADGTVYVYEVRNPMPVAFLANTPRGRSRTEALRTVFENREHPWLRGVVDLELDSSVRQNAPPPDASGTAATDSATIARESFNSLEINVRANAVTWLVLTYVHRPGWRASVDGRPSSIVRAYGGFMAVEVPAGDHTVHLVYTPWDVYLGITLSALALVLPFLAGIRSRLKSANQGEGRTT
ncbi:MAG: YfhO family protein [Planctomycetota bacterium]|nr:YfhO family protein [Planctomycetota bacterium]